MAAERGEKSGSTLAAATVVLSLLGLPVLYLLGTGPMLWLAQRGYVTSEFINWIYYPLIALLELFPWLQPALRLYLDLWVQ